MEKLVKWYDVNYKKLLMIPLILILFSLAFMAYFYSQNSDFFNRDISLIGGTSVTLKTEITSSEMTERLSEKLSDVDIRSLSDNSGNQMYLLITAPESREEVISALESAIGKNISSNEISVEFTSGSLGKEFYNQLLTAMLFAFLLMALVVFITFGESKLIKVYSTLLTIIALKLTFPTISQISFLVVLSTLVVYFYGLYIAESRKHRLLLSSLILLSILVFIFPYYFLIFPVGIICFTLYTKYSAPSMAVLISAFADILFTVVTINLLGMQISSGGIVALLMLIGYSVGTDILLTSRVLRRKNESINSACWGAFKTGITMTLTAISAIFVALLFVYRYETVLNQIFIILLIGLIYDIINTWFTNVWIIKWYAESKNKNNQGGTA